MLWAGRRAHDFHAADHRVLHGRIVCFQRHRGGDLFREPCAPRASREAARAGSAGLAGTARAFRSDARHGAHRHESREHLRARARLTAARGIVGAARVSHRARDLSAGVSLRAGTAAEVAVSPFPVPCARLFIRSAAAARCGAHAAALDRNGRAAAALWRGRRGQAAALPRARGF